jgi:hypothetical protein
MRLTILANIMAARRQRFAIVGNVAPSFSAAPVVLGTPTVGVPVAYTSGTYSGTPTPTSSQQWLLDGANISGATGATYTPITGDIGASRLSVRQTATNVAGSANSTSSAATVSAAGPTLVSSTINSAGTTLTDVYSVSVSIGAGGSGGRTLSPSGGAATLTYSSGSGSTTLLSTISRAIQFGETVTTGYTQPGNGIEATGGGADVASFSGAGVTNGSTQGSSAVDVATMQLTSATGGSLLGFSFGQPFAQGDIPNIGVMGADISEFQVSPKNYWPDGSLKFAVVSGRKTLTANVAATVIIRKNVTPSGGSALTTTDLKATGITASIQYAAYGTPSWATTDWDSPFETLVSGHEMSSWRYRKQLGSDAHLVAWLEVRLWVNGQASVMAWLENAYLTVAAPGARTGTATFTLGGSSRYSANLDLLNHQRAVLGSGTTWEHFLAANLPITPKHDLTYWNSTKVTPVYRANSASSAPLYSRLATAYTPLAAANHFEPMSGVAYHPDIGLLPEFDVAYLATGADVRAYRGCVINALAAGRYGMHYRDQATNRPLRFSQFPNLVMEGTTAGVTNTGASGTSSYTPAATGGTPPQFDSAHHPQFCAMAYLLTGWNYFVEEMQFFATGNFLRLTTTNRQTTEGIFVSSAGSDITRGAAWSIRTLAYAAALTPDADTVLRGELVASLNSNINWYHTRYVATANNPLGVVEPYDHYNDNTPSLPWQGAIWMDDFFTAAIGLAKDLQAATGGNIAKLDAFAEWKYKSIVGRLGTIGPTQYSHRYAEQYTVNYAPRNDANYTTGAGPWYAHWGEVARAMGLPQDGAYGATITGSYVVEATGYTSNYQPALAYAVDHNATGAAAAFDRLTSSSNWATHIATYTNDPVWSVKPRTRADATAARPTYTNGVAALTWAEIANSTLTTAMAGYASPGGSKQYICAYSAGAFNQVTGQFRNFGGGHNDYGGNEVPVISMRANTPAYSIPYNPSAVNPGQQYAADGKPTSRHTYSGSHYDDATGRFWQFNGGPYNSTGYLVGNVDSYNPTNNTWDAAASHPDTFALGDVPSAKDGNGDPWFQRIDSDYAIQKFKFSTNAFTNLGAKSAANSSASFCWDPLRARMIRFDASPSQWDISGTESSVSFTGAQAGQVGTACSPFWCDVRASFLFVRWGGTAVYEAKHNGTSYVVTALSLGGSTPAQASDAVDNFHGRFFIDNVTKIVYLQSQASQNWAYFKLD